MCSAIVSSLLMASPFISPLCFSSAVAHAQHTYKHCLRRRRGRINYANTTLWLAEVAKVFTFYTYFKSIERIEVAKSSQVK